MTISENHICPQCGAPLDQHLFVQTCSFCGYVSATAKQPEKGLVLVESSPQERYDYIIRHLTYIQTACPVEVKQIDNAFQIMANHPFFPNVGRNILRTLPFRYASVFTRDSFQLHLYLEAVVDTNPQLFFKTDADNIIVPLSIQKQGNFSFQFSFCQYAALCEAEELVVDTNLAKGEYSWDEFKAYSRRFYHSVFDRTRFKYSLHQKLYIDK